MPDSNQREQGDNPSELSSKTVTDQALKKDTRQNLSQPDNFQHRERENHYKKNENTPHTGDNNFRRKKFVFGKRISFFVKNPDAPIDYKRVDILVRFISNKGKIIPRKFTGLSALHQRRVAKAIKRARHASLLPYSYK